MNQLADYVVFALFGAATVALLTAVFVFVFLGARMWNHRKKGNWLYPIDILWWMPSRAKAHLTDAGMGHYRRSMKIVLGSFGLSLVLILAVVLIGYVADQR